MKHLLAYLKDKTFEIQSVPTTDFTVPYVALKVIEKKTARFYIVAEFVNWAEFPGMAEFMMLKFANDLALYFRANGINNFVITEEKTVVEQPEPPKNISKHAFKEENKAKCASCMDIIHSKHVHDFVTCKCGKLSIDGGNDYQKVATTDFSLVLRETVEGTWEKQFNG